MNSYFDETSKVPTIVLNVTSASEYDLHAKSVHSCMNVPRMYVDVNYLLYSHIYTLPRSEKSCLFTPSILYQMNVCANGLQAASTLKMSFQNGSFLSLSRSNLRRRHYNEMVKEFHLLP